MKALLVLISTICMFQAHANLSSASMSSSATTLTVKLNLDRGNDFTQKLVQALVQSPLVNEVVNPWVKPGSVFTGEGFSLNLEPHTGAKTVSLHFQVEHTDVAHAVIEGSFLRVTSRAGAFKNLAQALLQSPSAHVLTTSNPGRVSPLVGSVVILEKDLFLSETHTLSCSEFFRQSDVIDCSISIK